MTAKEESGSQYTATCEEAASKDTMPSEALLNRSSCEIGNHHRHCPRCHWHAVMGDSNHRKHETILRLKVRADAPHA
eukprot:193043-Rhodomonas_salina.2